MNYIENRFRDFLKIIKGWHPQAQLGDGFSLMDHAQRLCL